MNQAIEEAQAEPGVFIDLFKGFEIDADTVEQKAQVADMLGQEIDQHMKDGLYSQIQAGYYLHVMKESGVYKACGEHIKSWKDYVEKEKGISTGTDSFLRGIAVEFGALLIDNPELLRIEYKRLTEILTLFRRNKGLLEEYLAKKNGSLALSAPEGGESKDFTLELDGEGEEEDFIEGEIVEGGEEEEDLAESLPVPLTDEEIKEALLREASVLPKQGWQAFLQEVKGKTPQDGCLHDGEYDVLHRCRACGQVYAPDEGHSHEYNELMELNTPNLLAELRRAYLKDSNDAAEALDAWFDKRSGKFFVRHPKKGPTGICYTDMKAQGYVKEGFVNLIIEVRERGCVVEG